MADPNRWYLIAAYALTALVLVAYALRLRAARQRLLANRQGRS